MSASRNQWVAWIRQDRRRELPYRVMVAWDVESASLASELARFARPADARAWIESKGYRWVGPEEEA